MALQLGQIFKILATNGGVKGWIAVDMGANADAGGQHAIEADMDGETNTIESQLLGFLLCFKRIAQRFGSGDTQYSEFCSLCRWILLWNRWG